MKAIVAFDEKLGIGFEGKLPWPSIKEDFAWFKEFTMGKTLIMGKKTYDSLPPKKLPGRWIGILSNNWGFRGGICDIEDDGSLRAIGGTMHGRIHVEETKNGILCGGASIYKQFLYLCDELYVTHVKGEYKADTFFPFSMEKINEMFPKNILVRELEGGHRVIKYSKLDANDRILNSEID